jgi:hypothetical protein
VKLARRVRRQNYSRAPRRYPKEAVVPESKAIELKRGEMEPGDVLIEVTKDRAVLERIPAGRLYVCRCVAWDIGCEPAGSALYCYDRCVRWECEPVPKR